MNIISSPINSLRGSIYVPGDKSISHRAALLAAISEGESQIENFLSAGVTDAMLRALTALGVEWEFRGTTLIVQGNGIHSLTSPASPIDCGNSATTMRLLAGALAAAGVPATLDGSPGLRRRPMERIIDPLRKMGVHIDAAEGGTAPLNIHGRPPGQLLQPIDYTLPVASAQVKSCLLLAALAADGISTLHEPGHSRDHTERLLQSIGIPIQIQFSDSGNHISLTPPSSLSLPSIHLSIPGDASSAAFIIVAASIVKDSEVVIHDVGINPTRTGLIDVLISMGGNIQIVEQREYNHEPRGKVLIRSATLRGVRVSGDVVVRMIDEFPSLAIAAAAATSRTKVCEATELRHKESDRISDLCQELNKLGIEAIEIQDGFIIQGGNSFPGGIVQSHHDHRLVMAFILAGLVAQNPVIIQHAEVIGESYPGFVETMNQLGASLVSSG